MHETSHFPRGPARRIVIVRHAETRWSRSGRHTSHTDLPLTPDGQARAATVRGALAVESFERVFTSPLQRARQTCELAGFGACAEVRAELSEWDYGDYEGRTTAEIHQSAPGWSLWSDGAPRGETPEQVGHRADRVIAELHTIEGSVAVFSHGHFSRVLAARWIGLPVAAGRSFLLATAAIGVLGWDRGMPVIERWNDDYHVRGVR
jgi:broad specificity phosphatase PhoE